MSAINSSLSVIAATVSDPGAGGASASDLGIAGGIAGFAIIVLLMGGLGHRGGLVPTLTWFEGFSERVSGQPAWASLPCGLAIMSLISALFGLYWDVSMHIDRGRDTSVWGNPGHFFILGGLYGIFAAGFFAICLGREERADRPGPTAIRIGRDWYAPLGGVMMLFTGGFSLIAFPLDDFWHRLFGQDVTLWGPTHLMLIGGAVMTLLGIAVIQAEAVRAMKAADVMHLEMAWVRHLRVVWLPGGLLVGMSTFQGEFDFGIPQFQLIFHPLLIMLAAGLVLVMARIWLGRGAMFGAVGFFLLMRGGLGVLIHDPLGESLAHFPLYIVEALCVEAAAMMIAVKQRPLAFGAAAGALIGTVGLAAEWGWSHVWMPLPWSVEILPETIVLGLAMAISAGLLGAWIAARLDDDIPYDRSMRPGRARGVACDLRDARLPAVHLVADRHPRLRAADGRHAGPRAHRRRDGHAEPAQRGRGRHLADRDGLAGRRPRRRRPSRACLGGRLPHDEGDPRVRLLEDDDPHPQGQLDERAADLCPA